MFEAIKKEMEAGEDISVPYFMMKYKMTAKGVIECIRQVQMSTKKTYKLTHVPLQKKVKYTCPN